MAKVRILVVDDEPAVLQTCGVILRQIPDAVVVLEQDSRYAVELLEKERFDLLFTDLCMPDVDGKELLKRAHKLDPGLSIVVLTGFPTVETAVECLKMGASDYVTKPVDVEEFLNRARRLITDKRLREENSLLARQVERPYASTALIGESKAIKTVLDTIQRVAKADVDVLITGETGVGKELVARIIHKSGSRKDGHFVPVDCGAVPESLMESELFGHERGAFTGADRHKLGLLEFADRGTLFLDEIGDLPLAIQPKFLRALQERRFRRLGATDEVAVNIRVLAATNRDLPALVEERRFRGDLYYRIKVARIEIPPLRERAGDITLLVNHFVERYAREMGKAAVEVDPDALEVLARYPWPGNVRELQNVVRWGLTMARTERLTVDELPDEIASLDSSSVPAAAGESTTRVGVGEGGGTAVGPGAGGFFGMRAQHLERFEKEYLENLLSTHDGDMSRSAQDAQLPRATLYRLLKKYAIVPGSFRR